MKGVYVFILLQYYRTYSSTSKSIVPYTKRELAVKVVYARTSVEKCTNSLDSTSKKVLFGIILVL